MIRADEIPAAIVVICLIGGLFVGIPVLAAIFFIENGIPWAIPFFLILYALALAPEDKRA